MELARITLGIVVSLWLPGSVPRLQFSWLLHLIWSSVFGLYALVPMLPGWRAWILLIATVLVSLALVAARTRREPQKAAQRPKLIRVQSLLPVLYVLMGTTVTFVVLRGFAGFWHLLEQGARDNRIAIVLAGFLIAVFCANDVVNIIVQRFIGLPKGPGSGQPQDALIGEHIGWIERAIVFSFIVGGQPSAAALAITAKSLTRVADPKAQEEGFVEYFLIGTLSSLLVALVTAIVTRLTLGLSGL